MLPLLKRKSLAILPIKVLQFGEGNFLRAFIDWMINEMNKRGQFKGAVQMIQPLERGMGEAINAQDGLYTLVLRGYVNGEVYAQHEVIESVVGCLNPYTEWSQVVERACLPSVRFIFSNTTEAGIEYKTEEYTPGYCQHTYPAKLTSLMYARWQAFNGDTSKGVVFIPCELIDKNGSTLRKCMLQYATDWRLPEEFSRWLRGSCHYVNTLVDRIVAGYPRDEASKMCDEFGYQDNLIDCGEVFHFFVLESTPEVLVELPFEQCGLNAVITADQTPYRTRKVRFLNGAHTADVLAAAMSGLTYVDEMMNDPLFGKMVRQAIYQEIFPTVNLPEAEKKFYADSVVERFLNPFAHHRLLSISLNSVSKWKVRVLPSLLDYLKLKQALPRVLTFSLAALLRFYRLTQDANGGASASLGQVTWPVNDSPEVIGFFAANCGLPAAEYAKKALTEASFWGMDLNTIDGMTARVTADLDAIEALEIRGAVEKLF
jgi:tagaturonate reductase